MVELKTIPRLQVASASSTTESPCFKCLQLIKFISSCRVPRTRNSDFDGLLRCLLATFQNYFIHDSRQHATAQTSHTTYCKKKCRFECQKPLPACYSSKLLSSDIPSGVANNENKRVSSIQSCMKLCSYMTVRSHKGN